VGAAALAAVLTLIPSGLGRIVGIVAEVAFYQVYPRLQEREFGVWRTAHPDIQPLKGWRAVGWGLVGLLLFFVVFFVVAFPLALIFPSVL
jgi:hypothetical protein